VKKIEISEIITVGDFRVFLESLGEKPYHDSLENYLRTLLALVQENRRNKVTFSLLAQLILAAYSGEPLPFEEKWLTYSSPPDVSLKERGDYEYLRQMMLYQIADLHLMEEAGILDDPPQYFGVNSPTGHRWYNFDPQSYFSCAGSGLRKGSMVTECDWATLATILLLGQIYE
jgi:hypothetical protein